MIAARLCQTIDEYIATAVRRRRAKHGSLLVHVILCDSGNSGLQVLVLITNLWTQRRSVAFTGRCLSWGKFCPYVPLSVAGCWTSSCPRPSKYRPSTGRPCVESSSLNFCYRGSTAARLRTTHPHSVNTNTCIQRASTTGVVCLL